MLQSEVLKQKLSKSRERLAELSKKDDLTEGETTEMKELTDGYEASESKYRAAVIAEQAEEEEIKKANEPDGEERELEEIIMQSSVGDFINAQLGESPLEGASRELKQAFKAKDGQIPLAAFAPTDDELETMVKADVVTATTSTTLTRPKGFLEKLFAGEAVSHLGITPTMVQPGEEAYPVVTEGPTVGAVAKGTDREATAVTVDFTNKLSPIRCAGNVHFHRQDAYRIPGWEDILRKTLMDAIMSQMNKEIINGADDSKSNELVEGLLEAVTPKEDRRNN